MIESKLKMKSIEYLFLDLNEKQSHESNLWTEKLIARHMNLDTLKEEGIAWKIMIY